MGEGFPALLLGLSSNNGTKCLLTSILSLSSIPTAFSLTLLSLYPRFGGVSCVSCLDNCTIPNSKTHLPLRSVIEASTTSLPGRLCSGISLLWTPQHLGRPDNAEKHPLRDGRYLLPSFIYQTHGLLARMPVGLAMARVRAQGRPEPVSLKINSVVCSLRGSF